MTRSSMLRIAVAVLVCSVGALLFRFYLGVREEADSRAAAVEAAETALLVHGDASEALREAASGLERFPDEPRLLWIKGVAYIERHRLNDAEKTLAAAQSLARDPELRARIDFHLARARMLRYLETGDRGDRNQAQGTLETLRTDPEYGSAATLLLAMGDVRAGDPEGRARLAAALRSAPTPETASDRARAEKLLNRASDGS